MTIREIEERSGLMRANIRFYETEGLLRPSRRENGYRDYTQEDVQLLLKIRLLRTLRVPIEQIRALQAGELELTDVLQRQLSDLQREEQDLAQAQSVCTRICSDGAQFDTLDAAQYLTAPDAPSQRAVPTADTVQIVRAPWKRYLARALDLLLYGLVWTVVLGLCKVNFSTRDLGFQLLDCIVTVLLMLAVEPFLLSRFGTTLGKWVFGLGVTDLDGGRLSYRAAYERLKVVIWRGYGLFLPVYHLVRLWKSYGECEDGLMLDWDGESVLTLRKAKPLRSVAGVAGILALVLGVTALSIGYAELPRHRGEVSVAEFCENYNQLARYYDFENGCELNARGEWVSPSSEGVVIDVLGTAPPALIFHEQDGRMTGLEFSIEQENDDTMQSGCRTLMQLAALSFVRAQPGGGLFSRASGDVLRQMQAGGADGFSFTACGVELTCKISVSGYVYSDALDLFIPEEGETTALALSFSMNQR